MSGMVKVELLTRGVDGHAVPGLEIEYDPRSVTYQAKSDDAPSPGTVTAINCKFVWNGIPVRFAVPTGLLEEVRELDDDGEEFVSHRPTPEALALVAERMTERDPGGRSVDETAESGDGS